MRQSLRIGATPKGGTRCDQRLLWVVVLGTIILGATALAGKVHATPAPNAVTLWNERTQPVLATWTGRGNAAQAYTDSLVQIAVYDAVVAIRGGYRPFYADIDAPDGAHLDAAIATAAYRVTRTRVNVATTARDTLDSQYAAYLAAIPDGPSKNDGIAVGEAAAAATLAARTGDNFYNTAVYTNPPSDPGVWQSTPVANDYATAGANDYQMSFTIPVTADSPGARRAPPPIAMDRKKYARVLHEVQETGRKVGSVLTTEMTDVVQFWTESGFTIWTRNTRDIVISRGLDELESARALAALGLAGGEAMLACWDAKYHYMNWRPFQASPARRRGWKQGHRPRSQLGAAGPCEPCRVPRGPRLLRRGDGSPPSGRSSIRTSRSHSPAPATRLRAIPSCRREATHRWVEIIDDNANARVWGGLHYRTTMDTSARWIKQVVHDALKHHFKPVDGDDDDDDDDCDSDR